MKTVIAHPWYWHVPELGAPFGLYQYDFPTVFGDWLHGGLIKGISLFSHDPAFVFNTYMIAGFPFSAMSAFWVQRDLGLNRSVALVTSVAFSALPYHFGAIGWLLSDYFAVPLAAWLVIIVVLGRPVWRMHRRIPLPTAKIAIAALIVSGASVYWTAFCAVLLVIVTPVVALVRTSWRPFLRGISVIGMVVALAVTAQAPSLIYQARHGSNKVVAVRLPLESQVYGLEFADIVIPPQSHPVPLLANAGKRFTATSVLPAEGYMGLWLGSLGTIGLLIGTGAFLRLGLREPRALPSAGFVSLTAVLVSWAGGVSALIAWYLSPQLHAWDRMCVVIGFTSLLSAGLVLDSIRGRLNTKGIGWRRYAIGGGLTLLLALAVYDQIPQDPPGYSAKAYYARQAAVWHSQEKYTTDVVARLPRKGAMVLELPYIPFPEAGAGNHGTLTDYEQLRPYVQTMAPVKWSGGAMKGRPTDWGSQMFNWSTPELVVRAAAAGFDGIWLDHRAYAGGGVAMIGELSKALGGQKPFNSPDGTISFFSLRSVEREQAALYTQADIDQLGDELVRPSTLVWGTGFGGLEQDPTPYFGLNTYWHWLGSRGTLTIDNPTSTWRNVELRAFAYRALAAVPATVSVVAPAACRRTFSIAPNGSLVKFACRIPPGKTNLEFVTTGPETPVTATQTRPDLRVRLENPQLEGSLPRRRK